MWLMPGLRLQLKFALIIDVRVCVRVHARVDRWINLRAAIKADINFCCLH